MKHLKDIKDWRECVNEIICGDCLKVMKLLADNSVDSIVTDPPYEIGFMGKSWDNTGIANSVEMWKECLRVLKPGGYLLAFSGTRTYHRMACAIEDAGFEVRDMIEWIYGSGFPKSLNIGKAVDKLAGKKYQKPILNTPVSEQAKQWEGWGTALKPAHEPICMARKPLAESTVALNVLKYGTGGINIDESRVFTTDNTAGKTSMTAMGQNSGWNAHENKEVIAGGHELGRFPANLIHDNSEEVRECFPNESERFFKSIIYQAKSSKAERNKGCEESNRHPTVKPIALMEYLIKMVTSKGGIVLDPFAGSGSTLVAAKENGYQYTGIELTPEYIPIIEARLGSVNQEKQQTFWN